jgi:hypothetical protein
MPYGLDFFMCSRERVYRAAPILTDWSVLMSCIIPEKFLIGKSGFLSTANRGLSYSDEEK